MPAPRNFVLFKTALFLYSQPDEGIDRWRVGGDCAAWFYVRILSVNRIQPCHDPVMEDWGWTFDVSVAGTIVTVNVWDYSVDNCWLLGLEPQSRLLFGPTPDDQRRAGVAVADALDAILRADSRFVKHEWFAENPFDLQIKEF